MTKSDYILKNKNRTKNIISLKNECHMSIPIYPENLATFEENLIFVAPFGRVRAPVDPNVI